MISFENLILITLLSPLLVCLLTPLLSSKPILRDILGPLGGIISSWGAIQLMASISVSYTHLTLPTNACV